MEGQSVGFVKIPLSKEYVYRFTSNNYPDYYFRHRNLELWLDKNETTDLYIKDSSWKIVSGLNGRATVSFESINFPGHYLRHSNFLVGMDKFEDKQLFKEDSSFYVH